MHVFIRVITKNPLISLYLLFLLEFSGLFYCSVIKVLLFYYFVAVPNSVFYITTSVYLCQQLFLFFYIFLSTVIKHLVFRMFLQQRKVYYHYFLFLSSCFFNFFNYSFGHDIKLQIQGCLPKKWGNSRKVIY